MLRIGKNPKDLEQEGSAEKDASPYNRTYNSFQETPEARTQTEHTSTNPRALTESESLAREIKEGNLSGFVGSGTVTGEANFKALMRVDGNMSGRIASTSGTLVVGANGKVEANIEVAIAMIHGTVNGDIIATQRLELGRAAKLTGNVQTASLMIEPGALFEGSCKMIKVPASAAAVPPSPPAAKPKSNGKTEPLMDTARMDTAGLGPISADAPEEPAKIEGVTRAAS